MGLEKITLLRAMRTTAEALTRARVVIEWDFLTGCSGLCTRQPQDGAYVIALDPRQPIDDLYKVYLHEVGHAYLNARGMTLPDQERAAWELASIWAQWLNGWKPRNIIECIGWVNRLQKYHDEETNPPRRFTRGKNAGWIIPGVNKLCQQV